MLAARRGALVADSASDDAAAACRVAAFTLGETDCTVILSFVSETRHVVLIHGAWCRGESWAATRTSFEERGYTVHTPTLRHHDLPLREGAMRIAPLSLRDYAGDLAALVDSLESPPLLVGLSLGGLLAQLVAARTRHVGLVAAGPVPAAGIILNPLTLRGTLSLVGGHYLRPRPWSKPLYPPTWRRFRRWIANTSTEEVAREVFPQLAVCESGRAYCELACPHLDRGKATRVDFAAVTTPVLVLRGEYDRGPRQVAPWTAARYQNGAYVEIPGADHLVFSGAALPVTMDRIDDWIAKNRVHAR